MTPVLSARALSTGYGGVSIVRSLDLEVFAGEVVSLIGPNGAGKTTTLLALAGILAPREGEVLWNGHPTRASLQQRARQGLALVTEERAVFTTLTFADNLAVGGVSEADVLAIFPELDGRRRTKVGQMSGGQQQMLALGIALARHPKVLLVDELSLGLAPQIVDRLVDVVGGAARRGCAVLMVEQHAIRALAASDRVYVMQRGTISLTGPSAQFIDRIDDIERSYFEGTGSQEQGSDAASRFLSPEDAGASTSHSHPRNQRSA